MDKQLKLLIKNFKGNDFKNFVGYVYTIFQKQSDAQRKKVDKDKYIQIRKGILGYIVSNERAITSELRKNKNK